MAKCGTRRDDNGDEEVEDETDSDVNLGGDEGGELADMGSQKEKVYGNLNGLKCRGGRIIRKMEKRG